MVRTISVDVNKLLSSPEEYDVREVDGQTVITAKPKSYVSYKRINTKGKVITSQSSTYVPLTVKIDSKGNILEYKPMDVYQTSYHSNSQMWDTYNPLTQQVVMGTRTASLQKLGHVPTFQRYVDESGKSVSKDSPGAIPRFEETKTGMTQEENKAYAAMPKSDYTVTYKDKTYNTNNPDFKPAEYIENQKRASNQATQNIPGWSVLLDDSGKPIINVSPGLTKKIQNEGILEMINQEPVIKKVEPYNPSLFMGGSVKDPNPPKYTVQGVSGITGDRVTVSGTYNPASEYKDMTPRLTITEKKSGFDGLIQSAQKKLETKEIAALRDNRAGLSNIYGSAAASLTPIASKESRKELRIKAQEAVVFTAAVGGLSLATGGSAAIPTVANVLGAGYVASRVPKVQANIYAAKGRGQTAYREGVAQESANALAVLAGGGIGAGAVMGVPKLNTKIGEVQLARTQPKGNYVWGKDYVLPKNTPKRSIDVLNSNFRYATPEVKAKVLKEVGGVMKYNIPTQKGFQTQLYPGEYKSPSAANQNPLDLTKGYRAPTGINEYLGKYTFLPRTPQVEVFSVRKPSTQTKLMSSVTKTSFFPGKIGTFSEFVNPKDVFSGVKSEPVMKKGLKIKVNVPKLRPIRGKKAQLVSESIYKVEEVWGEVKPSKLEVPKLKSELFSPTERIGAKPGIVPAPFIPISKPKSAQKNRQTQTIKLITASNLGQGIGLRLSPKYRFGQPQKQSLSQTAAQTLGLRIKQNTKQGQRQYYDLFSEGTPTFVPSPISTTPPTPPIRPIYSVKVPAIPKLPGLDGGLFGNKKPYKSPLTGKKSYVPTLIGMTLPKIKFNKALSKQTFTGLEARPEVKF